MEKICAITSVKSVDTCTNLKREIPNLESLLAFRLLYCPMVGIVLNVGQGRVSLNDMERSNQGWLCHQPANSLSRLSRLIFYGL